MKTRRSYPSDLSDKEWEVLRPLVPEARSGGRPRAPQTRELLDGGVPREASYLGVVYLPDVHCEAHAGEFLGDEPLHEGLVPQRAGTPDHAAEELYLPLPVPLDPLDHPLFRGVQDATSFCKVRSRVRRDS